MGTGSCAEEPDVNYRPYDIFCLNTWLPTILEDYQIGSIDMDDRMVTVVVPAEQLSKERIGLLQQRVNYFTSAKKGRCLLYDNSPITSWTGEPLNAAWVKSMLPYLNLKSKPIVEPEGISCDLQNIKEPIDKSLAYDNYIGVFNDLFASLVQQLRDMYVGGYILNASSIAKDWELELVDVGGLLYRTTWQDNRFASDMYTFLLDRLHGSKYIWLPIEPSLVYRHLIAELLGSVLFTDYKVRIEADSLSQARHKVNLILSLSNKLTGTVEIVMGQFLEGYTHYFYYDQQVSSTLTTTR